MAVRELLCTKCGAPLPPEASGTFSCPYCGATLQVVAPVAASLPTPDQKLAAEKRFVEALDASLRSQHDADEALVAALPIHVIPTEVRAIANAVLTIVRDFERETGASIQADATALGRVTHGYLRAIDGLATDTADLNLPFLAATAAGPVHLSLKLTPELVASYAAAVEPPPEPPPPPPAPPKKKGWFF